MVANIYVKTDEGSDGFVPWAKSLSLAPGYCNLILLPNPQVGLDRRGPSRTAAHRLRLNR
jgi:hypothetical protein